MPLFKYKAIDSKGKVVSGSSDSKSLELLMEKLKSEGLFFMEGRMDRQAPKPADEPAIPLSAVPEGKPRVNIAGFLKRKVPLDVLAIFTTQLSIMVRTALPLFEALGSLAKQQVRPKFKGIISQVNHAVQQGIPLSQAFARFPEVFDPVYLSLLSAGEATGKLDVMLDRIAKYLDFQREMRTKIRASLLYPSVIVLTSMAVVAFLVLFILPTFVQVFSQFEMKLPLPTRVLLSISEQVRAWWWVYLLVIGGGWVYFVRWLSNPSHTRPIDALQLQLPVIGTLVRNVVMTRVLRTLSALVSSGVPILQSLDLARASAGNAVFREIIDGIHKSASEGKGLTSSLYGNAYFPEQVSNMIRNAEKTGTLPEVLTKVADFYEKETDSTIKNVFSVLEPLFVIFLGVMVAGIAVAVLLPIFQLDAGIQ